MSLPEVAMGCTLHFSHLMFQLFALGAGMAISTNSWAGNLDTRDASKMFGMFSQLNRYSPIDGAGSHGTIGYSLGLGASLHQFPETNELQRRELRLKESEPIDANITLPQLSIIKGVMSPLDIGLTLATIPTSELHRIGAHLQWTVFEDFQMPAVAVRGSFSRITGLPTSEFSTIGFDAVLSYGFLSYFTGHIATGIARHEGILQEGLPPPSPYTMSAPDDVQFPYSEITFENSHLAGLSIRIVPPFITTTAELQLNGKGRQTWLGKLSMGM